ncbi:acyltransferase family protein [Novosphingobium terrae]|uniref:acyltransferase family protein n=1 Tax=Novosphingobium terrae TaxID=2726189 RepID=UPI00197DA47E|nr:acyltransferase [Novosphingobium terrae]
MTPPKGHRLPLLDGLRGVAAIMVMLHHEGPLHGTVWPLPRAYLAVDFFFMLSGLVLTPAFEPRLRKDLSPTRFLIQRFARLWPVLAVGVLIGGAAALLRGGEHLWPLILLASLLLLPWPRSVGGLYRLDGPQWSIGYELLANALHAGLLVRLSDRAVLGFALITAAIMAWQIAHFGEAAMGDTTANWWGGFARVAWAYALGVWLGRRLKATPAIGRWWLLAALPLPLTLGLLPFLPLARDWGDGLAVFVLLPMALWLGARVALPAMAARCCGWLGALSYPLYAIHGPLLVIGAHLTRQLPEAAQPLARIAVLLAILLLAQALALSPLARGLRLKRS